MKSSLRTLWLPRLVATSLCVLSTHSSHPIELERSLALPSPGASAMPVAAQSSPTPEILAQGTQLSVNGRTGSVAWRQWRASEGNKPRLGISDTGLMQAMGVELLDTDNFAFQPVTWYSQHAWMLPATLSGQHRYLHIDKLAQARGWQWQISGETLQLTSPLAGVQNIRAGRHPWGKRIVVDLDRAAPWQLDRRGGDWIVILEANTPDSLMERFRPQPDPKPSPEGKATEEEEEKDKPEPALFRVSSAENRTVIALNLPVTQPPRIATLGDPARLVIDVRPDSQPDRDVYWAPGIWWRSRSLSVGGVRFPTVWLEVDLQRPEVTMKPIWSNPTQQQGTVPLWQMARQWKAAAAINSGFFNRNNQLPLGAIRRDGRWFSGPILNRGAIAWNDGGQVEMARLSLRETLIVPEGDHLGVLTLNSGYVRAGIARYTPEWGATYTPMTDSEVIFTVMGDRVAQRIEGSKADEKTVPIPRNGYLLVVRSDPEAAATLEPGMALRRETETVPPQLARYPHIAAAGPLLVQDGNIVLDGELERFNDNFRQGKAPRSAIARLPNNRVAIVAVRHGSDGKGPTLAEMAKLLQQLGAIDALNLDGGSSTSLYLGGQLVNRSPRTVARVHDGLGIFLLPSSEFENLSPGVSAE